VSVTTTALVVEIASPRTRLYDRNGEKGVYEGFGVPSYWATASLSATEGRLERRSVSTQSARGPAAVAHRPARASPPSVFSPNCRRGSPVSSRRGGCWSVRVLAPVVGAHRGVSCRW
jgi:Putative restriction endonuclease